MRARACDDGWHGAKEIASESKTHGRGGEAREQRLLQGHTATANSAHHFTLDSFLCVGFAVSAEARSTAGGLGNE